MNRNIAIFTICAKNYLAQAITLRESVKKYNQSVDFFVFLADEPCDEINNIDYIGLSDEWCRDWKAMALKYNVIEFSTSIKPFCFGKLFQEGYEKVMYLDPDIYVIDSLDCVLNYLDTKSIVLTPHYCDIVEHFNGAVDENTFMNAGVFNLGFCAIKNNDIGRIIIKWWKNRLHSKCYSQHNEGLFTDQKWMDFIPAFFPNECLISHHFGLNNAIWNLHERELIYKNEKYSIVRNKNQKEYPLLFFHFSGFDPFDKEVINRRHPQYNTNTYPSFKPIIEEYRAQLYKNGFDTYRALPYAFNSFADGSPITALHRRLFRTVCDAKEQEQISQELMDRFFLKLKENHLLLSSNNGDIGTTVFRFSESEKKKSHLIENKLLFPMLRLIYRLFGYKRYSMIINISTKLSKLEFHTFLMNK